jgi:hypothetical protein
MMKLDEFAKGAMEALIIAAGNMNYPADAVAAKAYQIAHAMVKESNKAINASILNWPESSEPMPTNTEHI